MTDSELLLVPRPQRLERRGSGAPIDAPVRTRQVDDVLPQGFRLEIGPGGVDLHHRDDAGRRYGEALVEQIRSHSRSESRSRGTLPGLLVEDWPDFPVRGLMLDISRDRVPTRATLERLVGLMALARINHFQLYTEHTFAFADHDVVWRDASPLTAEDIRWLDELCRDHGIELVPNLNTFGHMARWLQHDAYRDRAEAPDGYDPFPGMHREPAVLAPTQDNADFVLRLLDEMLPNFASRQVNVNCDETFELGFGASKAEVERRGREAVYVEHLRRIVEPLVAQGRQVQFWADILRRDPALVRQLPDDVVPIAWTYEAPSTSSPSRDGLPPEIQERLDALGIDSDAHTSFTANTAPLVEAGVPFWVAPGTSSWLSLVGRSDNARANLLDAAEVGRRHGAAGYLITDWGDDGHLQPPSISFGPLLFGGAVSWALAANRDLDVAPLLDHYVFGDARGTVGGLLDSLGRAWRRTGVKVQNASPLQVSGVARMPYLTSGTPDASQLGPLVEDLDAALATIAGLSLGAADGVQVRHELYAATRLARHGAWRLLRDAGGTAPPDHVLRADLAEAIDLQAEAWRGRSGPGGLDDSLRRVRRTLASYGEG